MCQKPRTGHIRPSELLLTLYPHQRFAHLTLRMWLEAILAPWRAAQPAANVPKILRRRFLTVGRGDARKSSNASLSAFVNSSPFGNPMRAPKTPRSIARRANSMVAKLKLKKQVFSKLVEAFVNS